MLFDYDDDNIESIKEYANQLVGSTYNDILKLCKDYLDNYDKGLVHNRDKDFIESLRNDKIFNNTNAKGQLGNFLEKFYFGYEPNSNQEADLSKVGIEIKQTPIDLTKKGEMRAGERLSITMISYSEPVEENFYKSHVWNKIKKILLVHYLRDKSKERLDYPIQYVSLFTPPQEDLEIIIEDYKKIIQKIKEGKAHELSESDTLYLGACTKGSTAESSFRPQYYNRDVLAKTRNFCFKQSYMNYVLHEYVIKSNTKMETIKRNKALSFEESIIEKIKPFYNKSDKDLMRVLGLKPNKALWNQIIYRILGISGNRAEEFVKANIKIKTIRVEENGYVKEHMPLPNFQFKEIINQEFEDSDLYHLLTETKYLMVFFYKKGESYFLKEVKFWNMPYSDIDTIVRREWYMVKQTILDGVRLEVKSNKVTNNLLASSESEIIHVRPHAPLSAYRLHNGFVKGKLSNCDELPNGEMITKQSFWINKEYLIKKFSLYDYDARTNFFKRKIKCPHCAKEQRVDIEYYISKESSEDRENGMGLDITYELDSEENYKCIYCCKNIRLFGWIREYPIGTYDSEKIFVE